MVRRVHRFFNAQAGRVIGRYLAEFTGTDTPAPQPPYAEELLPDSERTALWLMVLPSMQQTILAAAELAGQMVGLDALNETDPQVQQLLRDAQLHIAGVHAGTLDAIRTTLAEGFTRGYSVRQIAHGVPAAGFRGLAQSAAETYVGRAQMVSRTEITTARQNVALERYQEAGISTVYVSDEGDCGWMFHADPDLANASIRTLVDARRFLLSHPGCSRVFAPVR